jgi:hypothetical protein
MQQDMLNMNCITKIRQWQHAWYLHLFQLIKSAAAEHSFESGHKVNFKETIVVARITQYTVCIVYVTDMQLQHNNFNKDGDSVKSNMEPNC